MLGPHRDDVFLLNGRDAKRFASHGQQRSVVIALKAAQIQLFNEKKKNLSLLWTMCFQNLTKKKKTMFLLLQEAEQVFLTVTEKVP